MITHMESNVKVFFIGLTTMILCIQIIHCNNEQQYTNFNKLITCKLKQRLKNGSAHRKAGEYQSLVKCAAACQDGCCGVSLSEPYVCYHHLTCTERIFCSPNDHSLELYIKNPCKHNGVWDQVRFACKCTGGWVGNRCERYPRTCKEMTIYGYEDGFQKPILLHPETSPQPFTAYCSYYRDQKEYFTYMFYNTGQYDNTMTWSDYVNGFQHDNTNYWLGLKKMKHLNDAGYNDVFLRISVNISGSVKLPYYSFTQFRMGSAKTGYNFTAVLSEYNSADGVYRDCLTPVLGAAFSTADHDTDLDTENCARDGKAGWWFKTCDVGCNPLGPASSWKMTNFNMDRNILKTYMYFRDV